MQNAQEGNQLYYLEILKCFVLNAFKVILCLLNCFMRIMEVTIQGTCEKTEKIKDWDHFQRKGGYMDEEAMRGMWHKFKKLCLAR